VQMALAITTSSLPTASVDEPYSLQLTAAGGVGTLAWAIVAGALPAGLSLSPTGLVRGTPAGTSGGWYSFTVRVTDAAGSVVTRSLTIAVAIPVRILTTGLATATVGDVHLNGLSASGGIGTITWTLTGGVLPAGLVLGSDGILSGTATGPAGSYLITVTATDSLGSRASMQLALAVRRGATIVTVDPVVLRVVGVFGADIVTGTMRARLTDSHGNGIAGRAMEFSAGSDTLCTATTDANGYAVCSLGVADTALVVANRGVEVRFVADDRWRGSDGSAGLT
jgi:hypothetical protein